MGAPGAIWNWSFLRVKGFSLFFLSVSADGIKCYQCTPDPLNVETCGHPTTTVTCPSLYDSCASFSVKMKMPGGDEVSSAAMTCGSTVTCDQAQQAACDAANVTGTVTQCSLSCCLEDLCNSGAQTVEPTAATEASTGEDSTTSTAGGESQSTWFNRVMPALKRTR